jgi:hypothetical protein
MQPNDLRYTSSGHSGQAKILHGSRENSKPEKLVENAAREASHTSAARFVGLHFIISIYYPLLLSSCTELFAKFKQSYFIIKEIVSA